IECSYVCGIDAGNQSGIVAVLNRVAAEQSAAKTPTPASHQSAGLLDDIVGAVLNDLPINSEKRSNRRASLFDVGFLSHQVHDRARDQGFDPLNVCKMCLSDLHRSSTRSDLSYCDGSGRLGQICAGPRGKVEARTANAEWLT